MMHGKRVAVVLPVAEAGVAPASRRRVTALLTALVLATVLPALLGAAHATGYARIPIVPVSPVREVMLTAPGVRPLTDLQGLAVTPDGAILVAELGGRRLVEFRDGTSGSGTVLAGGDGPQPLQRPFDVALTRDGVVVMVLDQANGLVHRLHRDGRRLPPLALGAPGARALAVDADGAILVGDTGAGVVRRYRPDGSPEAGWGARPEVGQTPVGEAVGVAFVDGQVMAASGAQRGVMLLDGAGLVLGRAATIGNVGPLARLPDGRLLMTDLPTNRVWILDGSGRTVGRLRKADGDETLFFQPRGVAAPGDGCLYVASDRFIGVYRAEGSDTLLVQPGVARRC
jgi:DNA-binding beta-propeller fold protein YncE